eukprot:3841154-Alexandrium_andersonii.AAC.1
MGLLRGIPPCLRFGGRRVQEYFCTLGTRFTPTLSCQHYTAHSAPVPRISPSVGRVDWHTYGLH